MSKTIALISPTTGKTFVERQTLGIEDARAAVARARAAQPGWAALPLDERVARIRAGIAALNARKDAIVPELADHMVRPVR